MVAQNNSALNTITNVCRATTRVVPTKIVFDNRHWASTCTTTLRRFNRRTDYTKLIDNYPLLKSRPFDKLRVRL